MTTHRLAERPWELVRSLPAWATKLPDADDIDHHPQLGPIALLQSTADLAVIALHSRHGIATSPSDELLENPHGSSAFIARLVVFRCVELSDLLAAYRIAIHRESDDSDDF